MSLANSLKSLREGKGLSVQELSERTHVGGAVIEDFERGCYDRISAAIYGSGFVKILATALGADPAPLRDMFMKEYQAMVDEKASHVAPKPPPLKFSSKRLTTRPENPEPKDPAANPLLRNRAAKKHEEPSAKVAEPPRKASPVSSARPASPVRPVPAQAPAENKEAPQSLFGDLFGKGDDAPESFEPVASEPPRVTAAPVPPPEQKPIVEQKPWSAPAESKPPVSKPAERVKGNDDFFEERPGFDFKAAAAKVAETAKSALRVIPLKAVGVAAAVLAVGAGLCFLVAGGGGEPEPSATDTEPVDPPVSVTAAATEPEKDASDPAFPIVSFTGSALTDNLLPPPDSYAE